jgi:hypothetical protein
MELYKTGKNSQSSVWIRIDSSDSLFYHWIGDCIFHTGVDIFFFKDSFNMFQLFFISLILLGVIGMRGNTKVASHEIIIDEIDEMI